MEKWKDVKGYGGAYQASNFGRIRSTDRTSNVGHKLAGRVLKQTRTHGDYLIVRLSKNGEEKACRVNRIIAQTFIENPNELPEAGHKDDNKSNNHADNLYWTTSKENNTHNDKHIRVGEKHRKPIVGLKGDVRLSYCSSIEAGRHGFNSSAIRNCLIGRSKTHGGYVWIYA
jgi:hypothetical protein